MNMITNQVISVMDLSFKKNGGIVFQKLTMHANFLPEWSNVRAETNSDLFFSEMGQIWELG